jgi:hypothetical protein
MEKAPGWRHAGARGGATWVPGVAWVVPGVALR